MSFSVLTKGIPELRDMFKRLNETKSNNTYEEKN